jgi:hypothetical protein
MKTLAPTLPPILTFALQRNASSFLSFFFFFFEGFEGLEEHGPWARSDLCLYLVSFLVKENVE